MATPRTTLLRPMQKHFQRWWEVTHPDEVYAAEVGVEQARAKHDSFWAVWQAAERSGFRLGIEEACSVLERDYDDRAVHDQVEQLAEEVRRRAPFWYKAWEKV